LLPFDNEGAEMAGDTELDLEGQLRRAITANGVSLSKLAQATGVHKAQLSRFLRAERTMTLKAAAKVCAHLGLRLIGPDEPK
jgi:transcriptional regulator with XRE-family HTH domain